jgi:hypothetical protein
MADVAVGKSATVKTTAAACNTGFFINHVLSVCTGVKYRLESRLKQSSLTNNDGSLRQTTIFESFCPRVQSGMR